MSDQPNDVPTCADCGKRVIYNVPRLGPAGGFVHLESGSLRCDGEDSHGFEMTVHPQVVLPREIEEAAKQFAIVVEPYKHQFSASLNSFYRTEEVAYGSTPSEALANLGAELRKKGGQ